MITPLCYSSFTPAQIWAGTFYRCQMKPSKPLGRKNYGSIPHLPNSRMGPGDHSCHPGQARIATEKARNKHDVIVIQEKLDGSNVGVAKIDNVIVPLGRAGYRAETSPYEQHRMFADWVMNPDRYKRFDRMLNNGERVVGEWLAQAHGTRYELEHEPFVAFDLMLGAKRVNYDRFMICVEGYFPTPYTLETRMPRSVDDVMSHLGTYGKHGAVDPIEGAVWRVENRGVVDFLVKWVRPDKVDGKYLEIVSSGDPVWNWTPA